MNTAECIVCGAVLVSKHRHDWVKCDCEDYIFIDGGNDYHRAGGPLDKFRTDRLDKNGKGFHVERER